MKLADIIAQFDAKLAATNEKTLVILNTSADRLAGTVFAVAADGTERPLGKLPLWRPGQEELTASFEEAARAEAFRAECNAALAAGRR